MASIIAAKAVDVQYEIVGKSYAITTQPLDIAQTGPDFDAKIPALTAAVTAVTSAS